MKNRSKTGANSWSRRDVLSRGAGALCALALPEFVIQKAFGQSTTTFDYYISPTGSDSNPGTQASPWAITSLQDTNSNNARMAGKKVGMIAGTYACSGMQSGSTPNDYHPPVLILPKGTAGPPPPLNSGPA